MRNQLDFNYLKITIDIYSNNYMDLTQNFKSTIIWEKFPKHKYSFIKRKSNIITSPKCIQKSIFQKIATFLIRSTSPVSVSARGRVSIRKTKQTKHSCRRCRLQLLRWKSRKRSSSKVSILKISVLAIGIREFKRTHKSFCYGS